MAAAIEAEHLFCAHGWKHIVRDACFQVGEAEIAVIVGVNGVGKTTLLSTIAGTLSPVRGRISVFGYDRRSSVAAEQAARSATFFLPERHWMPNSMLLREYLGTATKMFGIARCDAIEQIDAVLELFDLTKCENFLISALSTGQKKKVGLCLALLAPRRLLLFDEPFSGGLDPAGITAVRRTLLHRARNRGQTIVLTTPVPEFVAELADRLIVLSNGEVKQNLTRQDLQNLLTSGGNSRNVAELLNTIVFPEVDDRVHRYIESDSGRPIVPIGSAKTARSQTQ